MKLTNELIRLGAAPADKAEAIRMAAQILVDNGKTSPEYVKGMFEREAQENTYLGNGVAIPHGTPASRGAIYETAIAVLQVPNGVDWEDGEDAHLIVAIAAGDNEHLAVLKRLSTVVGDEEVAARLAKTADVNEIREALSAVAAGEAAPAPDSGGRHIIGITSCPTGVAHTYMAQEALEQGAKALGYTYKIETQGSVGAQNVLTEDDIAKADVVIIAADTQVDPARFAGKRLYRTGTKAVINDAQGVIREALESAAVFAGGASRAAAEDQEKSGLYKHLMTGVSYMLPFVVAGGLLIALGFAIGSFMHGDQGIYIYSDQYKGELGYEVFWLGKAAFSLFVPILGGFIGFSIAGRPGIAPGMVGGFISDKLGAGFLGAIFAGFIAGYIVKWLASVIKLPKSMDALKPMIILPLLGTAVTGLLMIYVLGTPVAAVLQWLTDWLNSMKSGNAMLVGAVMGGMMAVDMGGPVNKASYTVGTSFIKSGVTAPMAAVMAGGMVPPLAICIATFIFKNRFTAEEQEAGKACGVLGLSFITEGAIPFAAKDPVRVIPAMVVGSALAGALCMLFHCTLNAPHGGIFVLLIPNVVQHVFLYALAILIGSAVSAFLLGMLKKPIASAG